MKQYKWANIRGIKWKSNTDNTLFGVKFFRIRKIILKIQMFSPIWLVRDDGIHELALFLN